MSREKNGKNRADEADLYCSESAGREQKQMRRSGIRIMGQLIGLVKPLLPIMILAIILGTAGYLCAIFLTITAGFGVMRILLEPLQETLGISLTPANAGIFLGAELRTLFISLIVMAVLRGILHYGEQYCNHFIAFKLLAIIRHKVVCGPAEALSRKAGGQGQGKSDFCHYHGH